ncbi:hypothetical protein LLH00_15285 [bacterium]|nr:hypothetical protein [bacterium]
MSQKPSGLNQVWPERELCAQLGLPFTDATGRSRVLGNWIRGGLAYAEKGGRRFFFEDDVVSYLYNRRKVVRAAEITENEE